MQDTNIYIPKYELITRHTGTPLLRSHIFSTAGLK